MRSLPELGAPNLVPGLVPCLCFLIKAPSLSGPQRRWRCPEGSGGCVLGCGHRRFVASSVVYSKAEFGRKPILLLTLTLLAGDSRLSPIPVQVGIHQAGNVVIPWRSQQQLPEGRGQGQAKSCFSGHCVLGRAKWGSE